MKKEKEILDGVKNVYTKDLVDNLIFAYKNLEELGYISSKQMKKYRKMLKEFSS